MPVAARMLDFMAKASWIRKMFEEGARLKSIHGADKVYDFSLGNPDVPPPPRVIESMSALARESFHGYMPNAGYPEVRNVLAAHLGGIYGVALTGEEIVMTCGAGGAMNVVLKALLDPGDEVIALAPYFVEYGFYADNHGGRLVTVPCRDDFLPDIRAIERAIGPSTKAIIVNSPNNPTGRVYPESVIEDLARLVRSYPHVAVISDEPYRAIVYDAREVPSILAYIPNSIVVSSASKELSLAGERIGYIAVNPSMDRKDDLVAAMILANRILGFVNAPALMQRVIAACVRERVDTGIYERRRNTMTSVMDDTGLTYAPPEGAFYLFVRSPLSDEVAFCNLLLEERVLAVPGRGFGWPGWVRFAYCVNETVILNAHDGILRAAKRAGV
ncbi:MAG TPA: pyridoxal phosphate-dependent aminotransferase [Deltaproteobacteria bacterium]|nr:pyridoxal phosphate-dependent aminotransferase [Deltaproteobacteria bacterium]